MTTFDSTKLTTTLDAEVMGFPDAIMFVVDDDENVRKSLSRLLRASKFDVESFASAKEFLERTAFSGLGCVLLDYHMPDINGIELQAEMKRVGINLPVIFLTGKGDIPTTVLAMQQGAIDFLVKPVDEQILLFSIEKALKKLASEMTKKKSTDTVLSCLDQLTLREREVLNLVIHGLLNKQIAFELGIAEKTVKAHRGKVMEKMKAKTVADLVHKFSLIEFTIS